MTTYSKIAPEVEKFVVKLIHQVPENERDEVVKYFVDNAEGLISKYYDEIRLARKRENCKKRRENTIVIDILDEKGPQEVIDEIFKSRTKTLKKITIGDKIYIVNSLSPELELNLLKTRAVDRAKYQLQYKREHICGTRKI